MDCAKRERKSQLVVEEEEKRRGRATVMKGETEKEDWNSE